MFRRRRLTIPLVLSFYGLLALAAVVWDALRAGPSSLLPQPDALGTAPSLVLGLAIAAGVIATGRLLERHFGWARHVSEELARLIGPLSPTEILVFSAASGLAEELFFRGPLQATLGVWIASLIFGLSHGYLERRLLPWTAMATVVGLGLGLVVELTGSLLPAVLAHGTVNYFEFHALDDLARKRGR